MRAPARGVFLMLLLALRVEAQDPESQPDKPDTEEEKESVSPRAAREPSAHPPLGAALSTDGRGGGVPATSKEMAPQRPIQEESVGEADSLWRKPLSNRNQFPLSLLFLTLQPERGTVLDRKETFFAVDFSYANIVTFSSSSTEYLALDLESMELFAEGRIGLGRGFEVGGSFPVYYFYGGFLDGLISGFHETFGLPNDVRRREPDDVFQYHYWSGPAYALGRSTSVFASGDLTLFAKKAIPVRAPNELAVRAAIKLPTGSRDLLSGSGATDVAVGISASRVWRRAAGYFNASYHFLGDPDAPGLRTRDYLGLSLGGDLQLRETLVLGIAIEHLGKFIDSRTPVLDAGALQLVFGLRYRASDRFAYEWRFTEDLSRASPDVTFGFRWEFLRKPHRGLPPRAHE